MSFGADLRAIRKARNQTLAELAGKTGRSVGWHSQIERDLSIPDIEDLRLLATALGVPISHFFGSSTGEEAERGRIVRAGQRRQIGTADGLTEELLSPDLTDEFEVIHSTFAPHSRLKRPITRPTTELGTLISGHLDVTIGSDTFSLKKGDSFRIRGEPYSWSNTHNQPARAIWVISPPVY